MSLVLGPRGGGKSYLRAFATHVDSLQYDRHGTKILGGSEAQSQQIYNALKGFADVRFRERDLMPTITATRATYATGSEVGFIPASPKSVRGPHVPTLCLDEVDEIDSEIRDAAIGMCMSMNGASASVAMTSTWHNVGGPMSGLIERAQGGDFPLYTFCIFEVLEHCPEERSGKHLEHCPECPIVKWCHSDRDSHPTGLPKAKRSNGHYAIDSLIQKARIVSARTFEADYLCSGPRADGLWFPEFDPVRHVTMEAEYDPDYPVYLGVDSGVVTGAVWFQVIESGPAPIVTVFADYCREGLPAEFNARAILEVGNRHCNGKVREGWTDPAGGSRNPVGATVLQEYAKVGLHLQRWPVVSAGESLNLIEGMVNPANGQPRLYVHPRCLGLIHAFQNYRRAKRKGQWMDYHEDPQHPHEDLIDALRGAVYARLPARKVARIY